jgi:hypothetical protein
MGWDWRLRTAVITGLLFIPQVNVSGEPWWWWWWLTCLPELAGGPSSRDIWSEQEKWTKEWEFCIFSIIDTSTDILHAVKFYDMGPSRFTSQPKEGVLRIFIALKSPSSRPGLNPRPLGLVAGTLTTAPPRLRLALALLSHCDLNVSSQYVN